MKKLLKIALLDENETTAFAAREFIRLAKKCDTGITAETVFGECVGAISIGIGKGIDFSTIADKTLDDAIAIEVKGGVGYIGGSNARSVLIAVYRFFTEIGGAYLRPGRDGEKMPKKDILSVEVSVSETASYRYRGFCFEGSAGYEHIMELVDFAPKIGFNIFFTQLWRPTFALDRWYKNERNPSRTPAAISHEAEDIIVNEYDKQVALRGMNHHRMGHGWMPSILGEKSGLWHGISEQGLLTEDKRHLVAEINGQRKLFNGSAVDTCFCYGNTEARALIVKEVAKYAVEHPEVDTLHVWLADQPDNQCECELCRDTLPSDFYVDMLNEIDEELTKAGSKTRIVFLSYLELFWTPERARIKNPERFMLLYAPIRRPYHRPLAAQSEGSLAPFKRNKWVNPCATYAGLLYLDEWKKQFPGECVLFDYHLMWDMYNDITGEATGRMLGEDMVDLRSLGMDGMISCQGTRLGIVGALPMRLMGKALWDGKLNTDSEVDAFYKECYGADSAKCREVLDLIRAALDPDILRGVKEIPAKHKATCLKAKKKIAALDKILKKHERDEDFTERVSYIYLKETCYLADKLIDFVIAAVEKDSDKALILWGKATTAVREIEALYPGALDAFEILLVWHRHVIPVFFPDWKIDYDSGELTM